MGSLKTLTLPTTEHTHTTWPQLANTQPVSMTSMLITMSKINNGKPLGFPNQQTQQAFSDSLHVIDPQPETINGITYTPPLLANHRYAIPLTADNPLLTSLASVTVPTFAFINPTAQLSEFLSTTIPNNGYRLANLENPQTGELSPHLIFDNNLTSNGGHDVPGIISRIITGHENIGKYTDALTTQVLSALDRLVERTQEQTLQPLISILPTPAADKSAQPVHKGMRR